MIDNFKIEDIENTYLVPSQIKPFNLFESTFYPRYNQEGKYVYHSAKIENLIAKITGGRFTLENSLHKFVHGNNYTDFTHSEIISAIECIEKRFQISSKSLKFKRIEVALNFKSEQQTYNLFNLFGMNEFERMRSGKTVYGKKHFASEYNVKVYDKSIETKLNRKFDNLGNVITAPNNIQRFEIEYKKMRPLKAILITLSDLKNKNNLEMLRELVLKTFDKVQFSKLYDYAILTPRERELVFAGYNKEFWEIENSNKNTRKKKRALFNTCIKKMDSKLSNDIEDVTRNLMIEKMNYLILN